MKIHENWNDQTYENDIAILKLNRRATLNKSIWPIALPQSTSGYANTRAFVLGWGTIYFGGPLSDILQEVNIRIWDNPTCKENYKMLDKVVTDNMLCAGETKKWVCQPVTISNPPLILPYTILTSHPWFCLTWHILPLDFFTPPALQDKHQYNQWEVLLIYWGKCSQVLWTFDQIDQVETQGLYLFIKFKFRRQPPHQPNGVQ